MSFDDALADARRATRDQVTAVWQAQMDRIRDSMSRDWREQVARVIDDRFNSFETTVSKHVLEARREVIRSFGRHWNASFRSMQAAENDREWCDALLDTVTGVAKRCAFFSVKGETIAYQGARGYEPSPA